MPHMRMADYFNISLRKQRRDTERRVLIKGRKLVQKNMIAKIVGCFASYKLVSLHPHNQGAEGPVAI